MDAGGVRHLAFIILTAVAVLPQGRHLSIVLQILLDSMLHLLDVTRVAASPALDLGGSETDGAGCWWGSLVNTEEEGLLVLTQFLQTMWDTGGSSVRGQDVEAERTLPARARTHPGLPSQVDVPTREEALARDNAAAVLGAIRKLAALLWPADHPASVAAADSGSLRGQAAGYADWEVLQAEVLMPLPLSLERPLLPLASLSAAAASGPTASSSRDLQPPASLSAAAASGPTASSSRDLQPPASLASASCCWGEGLWCFNHACTNLSGPSELAMQTFACDGGCGVRYCSPECQAQGWRDGHRLSCARLRARREGIASTQLLEGRPV